MRGLEPGYAFRQSGGRIPQSLPRDAPGGSASDTNFLAMVLIASTRRAGSPWGEPRGVRRPSKAPP